MDVVIPARVADTNQQLDLALHQLERFHPDTHVYLVGHLPNVTTSLQVTHIPTVQGDDRFANTTLAMRTALDSDLVPDPFVWSNDDIYWTERHDPVDWHMSELPTGGRTRYLERKALTRTILELHGLPTLDYELHTPVLIRKGLMREAVSMGGSMRTVYGNLQGTGTYHTDVKVKPGMSIPSGPFVSCDPRTHVFIRRHLTDRFSRAVPG